MIFLCSSCFCLHVLLPGVCDRVKRAFTHNVQGAVSEEERVQVLQLLLNLCAGEHGMPGSGVPAAGSSKQLGPVASGRELPSLGVLQVRRARCLAGNEKKRRRQ
jgi:hypothetical protein